MTNIGVVAANAVFSGDGYSWGGGLTVSFASVPGRNVGLCIQLGECTHEWGKFSAFAHKIAAVEVMYEALGEIIRLSDDYDCAVKLAKAAYDQATERP